ncbi:hypothetical protein [Paracoccus denitrificans]|uniref:hypothetical protein n=1 Tax=Paracoccus denitrificans TaxID=266 RepID=UPI003365028C
MVGDVVMIGAGGTPPSEPAETETDPAAEASTAAAGQVLGIIAAQAKEPPAPGADQDAKVPEMRWFPVSDPVSLDGEDYVIGDDIGLTFEQHEALRKAGVVTQSWADGAAS